MTSATVISWGPEVKAFSASSEAGGEEVGDRDAVWSDVSASISCVETVAVGIVTVGTVTVGIVPAKVSLPDSLTGVAGVAAGAESQSVTTGKNSKNRKHVSIVY
jgi:hypothetical protein